MFFGSEVRYKCCDTSVHSYCACIFLCFCKVKEVLQPRRREELPPLDTSKRGDRGCLVTELEILQNMTKHFNGMSGSKGKVQGIRQRINFLKNMLSNMGEGY